MTPEELLDTLHLPSAEPNFAVVSPVPGLLSAALFRYKATRPSAERIGVDEVSAILAPYVGRLGYQRAQRDELASSLTLDANYVRRTDAELHWKDPAGS
jgi:hypothetical protein